MDFTKPDRKTRLAQLGFLFRHSFTIVGRNRGLIRPVAVMMIYAALMVCLFFAGLFLIFYDNSASTWLLIAGALMFLYKFFYYTRAELTLSRMVYEGATGSQPDYRAARKTLAGLGRQVRVLGFLGMAGAWLASRKKKESGFMALLLGGMVEIWDLVNHFLLPAIAIDRLSIGDGVAGLKRLRNHVPETLAGVFGIDIMGGAVRTLMAPAHLFGVVLGILGGLFFGARLPEAFSAGELGQLFPALPEIGGIGPETVFNWLPLFLIIFAGVLLHAVLGRLIGALKVIYFTLFYTRITHADDLAPDIRADLEGYLELDATAADDGPALEGIS